jgi:hypothetical protein
MECFYIATGRPDDPAQGAFPSALAPQSLFEDDDN